MKRFSLLAVMLMPLLSFGQINCPDTLPITILGNTEYCVGSPGSALSVQQDYVTYEWLPTTESTADVLLTAGNYQLVVTHYTGCTDTVPLNIQQVSNPPQPTVQANGPVQFCEGEEVTLSAPEGYPYYVWNTGSASREITVFESGTFTVSVRDWIGCESSSNSIQVIVDPLPVAAFSPTLWGYDVSFDNLSLNATEYFWDFGDGSTSTDPEPSHIFSDDGTMEMFLVAENDCGTDTAFLDLESVSVQEQLLAEAELFPNPASELLRLKLHPLLEGDVTLMVHDATGRLLHMEQRGSSKMPSLWELDVSRWSPGRYHLQLLVDDAASSETFLIQR